MQLEVASFLWSSSPALTLMLAVRVVLCSLPHATHKTLSTLGMMKALTFCIEAVRRDGYLDCQNLHESLLTIITAMRAL